VVALVAELIAEAIAESVVELEDAVMLELGDDEGKQPMPSPKIPLH